MRPFDYLMMALAAAALVWAAASYYVLRKWLAELRRIRFVVGLRRRSELKPTLLEVLGWGRSLVPDGHGRQAQTIGQFNGKVTVAIVREVVPSRRFRLGAAVGRRLPRRKAAAA